MTGILELRWSMPVRVSLQDGLERIFSSVNDALDFLENEWPMRSGLHYERAVALCRALKLVRHLRKLRDMPS